MKVTVSIAQIAVIAARPEENLNKAEAFIAESSRRKSNMVCFPEMWTTGFDWEYNRRAVGEQEKIIDRVAGMARKYGVWVSGSMLALNEEGRASNALMVFDDRGGMAGKYYKTHLFGLIHEDKNIEPGKALKTVKTPWGLIGLSVCYDLRFPEVFRSYALKGVNIVLSPMAFAYPKLHHWKALIRARAIENQIFMVGINQVGSEDFGHEGKLVYFGDSVIVDPWGEIIAEASETKEELITATIDTDKVAEVRSRMKVLDDRRPDIYEL